MLRLVVCGLLAAAALVGCAGPVRDGRRWAPTLAATIALEGVRAPRSDVGVPGRLDHFAYDPGTRRLFVAALENGSLEVIDLEKRRRVKSIGGLKQPQGIAIVSGANCAAVACGGDGLVRVYDARTLAEQTTIDVGRGADNVRYDARARAVYVSHGNAEGGRIAELDARTWEKRRELSFVSRPESFQLDPTSARVFANLPGGIRATHDGAVAVADRDTGQMWAQIELTGRARNFPMAYDAAHERLFIASRRPAKLIAIDTRQYAIIAEADCTDDSDDLFYDAKTNCVLVIDGGFRPDMQDPNVDKPVKREDETGAIDVFSVGAQGELSRVATTPTAPHARTGLFVPERRAIYVGVPPRGDRAAEIREYTIPGTGHGKRIAPD